MDDQLLATIDRLLACGECAAALTAWQERSADHRPAEAGDPVLAEIEERWGDQLWFADLPGAGDHYQVAQVALMPPQAIFADGEEAGRRQQAWGRIAAKCLYGIGPDGRRRSGASGEPHAKGCPPPLPPIAPVVEVETPRADQVSTEVTAPTGRESPVAPPVQAPPHRIGVGAKNDDPTGSREPYEHLQPGFSYRIDRTFSDFDGIVWDEGLVLRYLSYNYFPYDEGLTLYFESGTIRLCGLVDDQRSVMHGLSSYFINSQRTGGDLPTLR